SARPRAPRRPGAGCADSSAPPTPPGPATGSASELFCQRLPENRLVERQVGDELLELAILLAQLAELLQLARADVAELLLPAIVGLLADPVLAAHLHHRHTALPLPADRHHLLRRELARPHRPISSLGWGPRTVSLRDRWRVRKRGQDHPSQSTLVRARCRSFGGNHRAGRPLSARWRADGRGEV